MVVNMVVPIPGSLLTSSDKPVPVPYDLAHHFKVNWVQYSNHALIDRIIPGGVGPHRQDAVRQIEWFFRSHREFGGPCLFPFLSLGD